MRAMPRVGGGATTDTSARIELKLRVVPEDAIVHLDDMQIPTQPFAASFPMDKAGHKLTVRRDGYEFNASSVIILDS